MTPLRRRPADAPHPAIRTFVRILEGLDAPPETPGRAPGLKSLPAPRERPKPGRGR